MSDLFSERKFNVNVEEKWKLDPKNVMKDV